ncbi:MAG: hypothetical protein ACK5C0_04955 [Candidatus Kapaibacterium sp.]|jgi:hypothetical protein
MKKFLILIMLLCGINAVAQENAASLPELQEWWRAPDSWKGLGRNGASYLPNFFNDKGCLAVSLLDGSVVTWQNRFPGDTANIFSWQGGNPILSADFNGDGITDYIDGGGHVYQGVQNGQPPKSTPIRQLGIVNRGNEEYLIADVNADSCHDIIIIRSYLSTVNFGEVIYGNRLFSSMTKSALLRSELPSIDTTQELGSIYKVYKTSQGHIRLLGYRYTREDRPPYHDGYTLYSIDWEKGKYEYSVTTVKDYVLPAPGNPFINTRNFAGGGSETLYQSKHHNNVYALILTPDQKKLLVFDISKDIFSNVGEKNFSQSIYTPISLPYSINNDKVEDIVTYQEGIGYTFYSGINIPTFNPIASYKKICQWKNQDETFTVESALRVVIDDVNGDSINDMVFSSPYYFEVPNCFRIVLGLTSTSSVEDRPSYVENNVFPHPIKNNEKVTIDVTIPTADTYSLRLYDVQGNYKQTLSQFFAEKGNSLCSFVLSGYPVGEYIVVLQSLQEKRISSFKIILE